MSSQVREANIITAAKAKRAARKSQAPQTTTANAQALSPCPRCQRIFRARIGLVGDLRAQCTNNPTIPTSKSNSANSPSDSPTITPGINSITPTIKRPHPNIHCLLSPSLPPAPPPIPPPSAMGTFS
ncbi:unnamed protein product [Schistocephalus solidus]|uniref:Uncharacterized protein n=1 Tax=Schistocephalus solidus TaxID=70667 RepID=A0A183TQ34_SCHSO|nr:unnamed protein product [Schistocephalus solidus]